MIRSREWSQDGHRCAYDDNAHRYTLDGAEVPGITSILSDLGHMRYYGGHDAARLRGQLIHTATQLIDEGLLPQEAYDGTDIEDQVDAWMTWLGDQTVQAVEVTSIHLERRYGSTVDRVLMTSREEAWEPSRYSLVDIKTGKPAPWHATQLGALEELFGDMYDIDSLTNVYLDKVGGFSVVSHDVEDARESWSEAFSAWEAGDW